MVRTITPALQDSRAAGHPHTGAGCSQPPRSQTCCLVYGEHRLGTANVPFKLVLGHSTVRWYEFDVQTG